MPSPILHELPGIQKDLGGFTVARVLPATERRAVGPFVFFDHFGPADLPAGTGIDVRPHPHIGLATVTRLFEGAVEHRDSLGSFAVLRPGDVGWMTAGRGIVHSERSPAEDRVTGPHLHGLQIWVALPDEAEECDPSWSFHHSEALPLVEDTGVVGKVLAGEAWGHRSPVPVRSPLFYAELHMTTGSRIPLPEGHEERAAYLLEGACSVGGRPLTPHRLAVFAPGDLPPLRADADCHLVLLGGAPMGPRHLWWNFVSSSRERIEAAAEAWRAGRFPRVPGEGDEAIPLTDGPPWRRTSPASP